MAAQASGSSIAINSAIGPYEMRITEHTKMRSSIGFGLKFLQENPNRALVLHTLPAPQDTSHGTAPRKRRKLPTPTNTIPRLVSVVEVLRREYAAWAMERKKPDGQPADAALRTGLHQYNELDTLEELGVVVEVTDDTEEIRHALGGKKHLRLRFSPHLKVTLSVKALPELETKGATYQPPGPVSKSRSARKREQRKKRKEAGV